MPGLNMDQASVIGCGPGLAPSGGLSSASHTTGLRHANGVSLRGEAGAAGRPDGAELVRCAIDAVSHVSAGPIASESPAGAPRDSRDVTLASLVDTFQSAAVQRDACMGDVIELLRRDSNCVGVLVLDDQNWLGVISRELLARELAKPFYRELCQRRPVHEFLKLTPQSRLELPVSTRISSAVAAALSRPYTERYEPLVVRTETGHRYVLAVPALLTAQCHALDTTLSALEAQRQATLAAERERQDLHEQLVVASRQAGRAEVATGVLHNVGNVLNSVNVSASVIGRTLEQSKLPGLSKAVALIRENGTALGPFLTQDERGKRLPSYLEKLSESLAAEHSSVVDELKSLAQGLEHIKQVVAMQQSYARDPLVSMMVRPSDLFEDAIKVNLVSFERHNVTVERQFEDLPELPLDKHKILQILINVISNAKNAVKASAGASKKITVSTRLVCDAGVIRFVVSDTGIGIAPDDLTKIFSHGFTTRKEGHGFGLHSSANAATEMGGTLVASSPGLGGGATFVLELPVNIDVMEGMR